MERVGLLEGSAPAVPLAVLATLLGPAQARQLLAEFDIAFEPHATMPARLLWPVLRRRIDTTGDEAHAIGATVPEGNYHLLVAAMKTARTLEDALHRFAAAARLLRPDMQVVARTRRGSTRIMFEGEILNSPAGAAYVELFAVVLHCTLAWLVDAPIRPRRFLVKPSEAPGAGSVFALLGVPMLQARAGVAIDYTPGDGTRPLAQSNFDDWPAQIHQWYCRLIEAGPAGDPLATRVRALVQRGCADQGQIARELAMSPATLRRHLAASGTSLRALIREVQEARIAALLATRRPLEDIAGELGYSDSRSLRRVCTRWFGTPPSTLRERKAAKM